MAGVLLFPALPDAAATIGRIALGGLFLAHGIPKIRNLQKPMGFLKGTGFPGGVFFAALFTILEFFGGIALILGFLTQFVAVVFALEMVATTIFLKTRLRKPFIGGFELDVAYFVFAVVVALLGPGPLSVDRLLGLG